MHNQIPLIIVHIAIMLRFRIYFDPELQLTNSKPVNKSKLKQLLKEFKEFKIQTKLVLNYKK